VRTGMEDLQRKREMMAKRAALVDWLSWELAIPSIVISMEREALGRSPIGCVLACSERGCTILR